MSRGDEKFNLREPRRCGDMQVSIIGNDNTLLIEDFFPQPVHAKTQGVDSVWLTVEEARDLRDYLNRVLP